MTSGLLQVLGNVLIFYNIASELETQLNKKNNNN